MLVLGLKDQSSKERLMEREQNLEKTLTAARIAETSKQHMKSLKDEGSNVERVDSVDGSTRKHQGGLACRNCGILHRKGLCPAAGQQCHKCKRLNHFARMCRTPGGPKKQVDTVDDYDSDTESMFIGAVNLKKELDRMKNVGIIEKVPLNEPADWVSSLVCVDKQDWSIRVSLDPRDLNRAIKREHYPLSLLEDITFSCAGATLFSTLDAKKALYQIQLDEESSRLLTFNTPFGRYRYLRMPMGIKSAPEVYQRRMEQVFEGIQGVKVIMDDLITHGSNQEEHDTRLRNVLERARDNNLRLKKSKCHIKKKEVKFHGHVFTRDGLSGLIRWRSGQ